MATFFKRSRILETQIDAFLDAISQGAIVFKQAIRDYLEGETEKFEERIVTIGKL